MCVGVWYFFIGGEPPVAYVCLVVQGLHAHLTYTRTYPAKRPPAVAPRPPRRWYTPEKGNVHVDVGDKSARVEYQRHKIRLHRMKDAFFKGVLQSLIFLLLVVNPFFCGRWSDTPVEVH